MRQVVSTVARRLVDPLRGEVGQGLSEYALILVFVAIVAVAALTLLGTTITSLLSAAANGL
jgi:Flp pilus assembly pilin Flp